MGEHGACEEDAMVPHISAGGSFAAKTKTTLCRIKCRREIDAQR